MKKLESLLTIKGTRGALKRFTLGLAASAAFLAGNAGAQTTIANGETVTVTDPDGYFGSAGDLTINDGATLIISGAQSAPPVGYNIANALIFAGNAGTNGLKFNNNDTKWGFTGPITSIATGNQIITITTGVNGNGDREDVQFASAIPDGSGVTVGLQITYNTQTGANSYVNLSGSNTFSGPITLIRGNAAIMGYLVIGGERYEKAFDATLYTIPGSGSLGNGNYAGAITLGAQTALDFNTSANQTLSGVVSGAGQVIQDIAGSTLTLSGANTYTGNTTVKGGTLHLASTGSLKFVVNNTTANKVTGAGAATLDGTFTIDTSAVTVATNTWTLVDTTTKSFGGTFKVAGFTGPVGGVFTKEVAPGISYTFDTATGKLTLNSIAAITSFGIPGYAGVINSVALTISLTVPYGTDYATLAPNFTVINGTCDQTSGRPPTPTFAAANPVTYTVSNGAIVHAYAVTITTAPAPILFGTAGAPLQTFDAVPPFSEWSTLGVAGAALTVESDGFIDIAMKGIAASGINATIASKAGGGTGGTAFWRPEDARLETRASGGLMTLLMAKLYNASGHTIGAVNIAYTYSLLSQVCTNEGVPGHRLLWSKSGAAGTWTAVGDALLTSPNTNIVTFKLDPLNWAKGDTLFVVWADDNAVNNPDGDFTIDNVSFTSAAPTADMKTFGPGANISGTNITWVVPAGTALTNLAPTYTASYGATCPKGSGVPQDFSLGPVHYLLTSSDSLVTNDYKVTVTAASGLPVTGGLRVWLTADAVDPSDPTQVRTSGSDVFVQKWLDRSGYGNLATNGAPDNQPLYIASGLNGKPVVEFVQRNNPNGTVNEGLGSKLSLGDLSAQFPAAGSIYAVATIGTASLPSDGMYNLFGNRTNDERWVGGNWSEVTPGSFRGGRANFPGQFGNMPQSGSHLFALASSSTNYQLLVDGTLIGQTTGDYNSGADNDWTIGNRVSMDGLAAQLNGDIAELVIFNRILSPGEDAQMGYHLATKYGVATPYQPAEIVGFGIPGADGVIDQGSKTIALTVPYTPWGASGLASLAPTVMLTSGTSRPASGVPPTPNFAALNPATYTVIDETTIPPTTNTYIVTAIVTGPSSERSISLFFPGVGYAWPSDDTGTNLLIAVPSSTAVTALAPTYTVSQFASCSPASGTVRDFTTPQTYVVTAEDGTRQAYSVTVQKITTVASGYQGLVLATGPVSYWPLNETSGTTAFDLASGVNNLTYGTMLSLNQGGLRADGNPSVLFTNAVADADFTGKPYDSSLNPSQAFSVEFWIKPANANGQYLVSLQDRSLGGNQRWGYAIQRNNGGAGFNFTWGTPGPNSQTINGVTTIVADQVYHVVATFDGATMKLYVNGNLDGSAAVPTYEPATSSQPGFSIGSRNGNTGGQPANIQDVALYGRALTPQEIQTHLQNAPSNLQVGQSGGKVVLTWVPGGGGLQAAPVVTGPYTNVPAATSPYTTTPSAGSTFWRVKF